VALYGQKETTLMSKSTVTDWELMAYLDGVGMENAGIPHPTNLQALADLQTNLQQQLQHLPQLSLITLGEYQMGIATPDQIQAIETALATSPTLRANLQQLAKLLQEPEAVNSEQLAVDSWQSSISNLQSRIQTFFAQRRPSLAAVRDKASLITKNNDLVYQFGLGELSLATLDDVNQAGHKMIFGFVDSKADITQAALWRVSPAEEVAVVGIEDGDFEIAGISPNTYGLILTGKNIEVHIERLEIRD
jgi:hypothetical protein